MFREVSNFTLWGIQKVRKLGGNSGAISDGLFSNEKAGAELL